jgi:DNA repair protein RecO
VKKVSDQGIILARIDFGEKDRILTVLMREHGKVRVIAKAVRSAKSKLAGGIELFSESNLGYIEGRGEVFTLTSSRLIKHFDKIVQDYDKTELAYDVLKTVNKVVDDGYGQDYYPLVLACLSYLDQETLNCATIAIWFYLKLLNLMGNSINLKTDRENRALKESAKYSFDYEKHCFYVDESGVFDKKAVKLLRLINDSKKPISSDVSKRQQDLLSNLLNQVVKEAIR